MRTKKDIESMMDVYYETIFDDKSDAGSILRAVDLFKCLEWVLEPRKRKKKEEDNEKLKKFRIDTTVKHDGRY